MLTIIHNIGMEVKGWRKLVVDVGSLIPSHISVREVIDLLVSNQSVKIVKEKFVGSIINPTNMLEEGLN